MKKSSQLITGICASAGMLALILDSKTALSGASDGVALCVLSVIPALFPFFFLSALLMGSVLGTEISLLRPVGKLCGIPKGSESILLTGLLGGYPIGAQCICQCYTEGRITKADANRMLAFCSNAGPAFLFGMTGSLFENKSVPFLLWAIHILSALTVGALLPGKSTHAVQSVSRKPAQTGQAIQSALRAMSNVCGWVIIFRIVLSFAKRWFLWLLPPEGQVLITGLLELTNGYVDLIHLESEGLRFILASAFLAFGGVCVMLQTLSAIAPAGLDLGSYVSGKLMQTLISTLTAALFSGFLFPEGPKIDGRFIPVAAFCVLMGVFVLKLKKKSSSILRSSGV